MASRNATRDIRTRLIIEGEDEYKAALKSNADEAKELQSEMDLLTAKFEDNADSEDYLAQRTELLARQQENAAERTRIYTEYTESAKDAQERLSAEIDKARTTMSSLQTKIEQATSEYGENSEQVQKLTTQYQQYARAAEQMEKQQQKATSTVTRLRTSTNKAETSQVKFANALKNTDDATENASDGVGSLSDVLSGLGEKLGVDIPQEALTRKLPPMAVQMLVENAVKHNEISNRHPLTIHIGAKDGQLCISNRLQPKLSSSSGTCIGLANLSKRYQLLFGQNITIEETETDFKVTLPLI